MIPEPTKEDIQQVIEWLKDYTDVEYRSVPIYITAIAHLIRNGKVLAEYGDFSNQPSDIDEKVRAAIALAEGLEVGE